MNWSSLLLIMIPLSSFVPGLIIFFLAEEDHRLRTALNLGGAMLKLCLVVVLLVGVAQGHRFEASLGFGRNLQLVFHADSLGLLFVTLSAVLWLLTTLYAVGYLEGSPNRSQFFGFFSLCVSVTVSIALAGNLITFFIFYELLSFTTYPLVIHRGTKEALAAGRTYLCYTVGGGAVLLFGVVWLSSLAGPVSFAEPGSLAALGPEHRQALIRIFALFVMGLGVKAALFPLHGWLPAAMVAPAPVSALLHAVAVVKAGAFGFFRLIYDIYGVGLAAELGLLLPLTGLAALTIIYGSMRALFQDNLKHRLAFSTVSQVSYVVLGASLDGSLATVGGLVHLVHQGLMKITLFFCAGNLAETLGLHRISDMAGVARRLPWTMAAFTIAAFGMIGVPPLAGFVSKWYLGTGALAAGQEWILWVLVASSVFNAMYFLPIIYVAWFKEQEASWPQDLYQGRLETNWMLLLPPLVTALLVLLVGLCANAPVSPLAWARLIISREYLP